ncbi:MAG TPA: UDP-N-acetylmuramoyl-L-alanyl-D-glutamate--2,6-diaminopimelate ligase [Holophaga sp.]|nr:UDP-N-acetylmuramoyl-L-alanyl-D-glutamate--2,6-diaminopimelate ligase [Holophaga sp.]
MRLSELIQDLDIQTFGSSAEADVAGLACDSREIQPGWAFVALKGEHSDGAGFIPQVLAAGASAIFCDRKLDIDCPVPFGVLSGNPRETMALLARRIHGAPDARIPVIGVTGTNGKTTTTMLIRQLLRGSGRGCGLIGTVLNAAGDDESEATRTSPESPVFYRWLKKSADAGDVVLAIETSSHALCQARVHGARFKLGVFTNLTQDHLDFHGDMESYFRAKCRMFDQAEAVLVNADDAYGRRIQEERPARSYAVERPADYRAAEVVLSPTGTRFRLETPMGAWDIASPLLGRFNVYNLLAALASLVEAGFDMAEILAAVPGVKGAPGRIERVDCGQPFGVMVDYAHTPDALDKLLTEGKRLLPPGGRLQVLFGCGGDRDRTKRPLMAAAVAAAADVVWHTSDNTRGEDPGRILDDGAAGIPSIIRGDEARYHRIADRALAVETAIRNCRPGDLLLLAGKGHEPYQEIHGVNHPYSDRAAVEAVLRGEAVPRPWGSQLEEHAE